MAILLLDNYDSFTYNLLHLMNKVSDREVVVKKNDGISLADVAGYEAIVLSPGPGLPSEAGIMSAVLQAYATSKPVLGICLGLQAIVERFGGSLVNLGEVCHGQARTTLVTANDLLFEGCPREFTAARYHSWVADHTRMPPELLVTARDESGHVMAVAHKALDVRGVQFHPESILSECGGQILANWLNR